MIMEPAEHGTPNNVDKYGLITKSVGLDDPNAARQMAHKIQTNPMTLLLNSVVHIDSVYVLTLSEEKALSFGVSKNEYKLAEEYVSLLNDSSVK